MSTEEKKIELDKIAQEIKDFKGLEIARKATHAVPGEGSVDAKIMLIGEAPGQQEDLSGRPFVGMSGSMMTRVMTEVTGIKREDVFITNIVKFRPPENRDPTLEEIEACRDWLDRQIKIINPEIIVTLGRFSMGKFIPGVTISRIHGEPKQFGPYIIFPMFHPAAALRGTTVMNQFKEDFVKLKLLLSAKIEDNKATNTNEQLNLF